MREQGGGECHSRTDDGTRGGGGKDQTGVVHLCALDIPRTQPLPDDDGNRAAQRQHGNTEHITHGTGDTVRAHSNRAAYRITLRQHCHTARPHDLVKEQRHALDHDLADKLTRQKQRAVQPLGKGVFASCGMRINHQNAEFHKSCQRGGDRRAHNAQRRESEVTENEHVVTHKIDQEGDTARNHGRNGFTRFAQGGCIHLRQRVRKHADHDDVQILHAVFQRQCLACLVRIVQIERDQLFSKKAEQKSGNRKHRTCCI